MRRTLITMLVGALLWGVPFYAQAQTWVDSTTFSAAVSATATSVTVSAASGAAVDDYIFVDGEVMQITAVSGTTLTVRRGVSPGSAAASHGTTSRVFVGDGEEFNAFSVPSGGTCTAATELYLPHIDTRNNRVYDCEGGFWMLRNEHDMVHVRENTVRDSFDQGYLVMQDDGTAKSVTDDEDNFVYGSPLGAIEYREELGKTTSSWVTSTGALDISADDTVDNEGVEILFGAAEDVNAWFIAGTTGGCIAASIDVADISGTDQVQVGFRDLAAFPDAAAYAGLTIWNSVGINATDGSIVSSQEVSEATDTDDSAVNWADGDTRGLKVCVSAAGVPTAFYTAAYTHSSTVTDWPEWNAITMTNTGSTLTADQAMVPFISYLAAGTDGADVTIHWVELTRLP